MFSYKVPKSVTPFLFGFHEITEIRKNVLTNTAIGTIMFAESTERRIIMVGGTSIIVPASVLVNMSSEKLR